MRPDNNDPLLAGLRGGVHAVVCVSGTSWRTNVNGVLELWDLAAWLRKRGPREVCQLPKSDNRNGLELRSV